MLKKIALLVLGLTILALIIFGLLKLGSHPAVENLRGDLKNNFSQGWGNLMQSSSRVERPRPLTTLEMEEALKIYLEVPFKKFDRWEWEWFWNLLYGTAEEDAGTGRKRQLTREEIQDELAYVYSQPFGFFGEQQWTIFWQQILKGKVF